MEKNRRYDLIVEVQVALVMLILAFSEFAPVSEKISFIAYYSAFTITIGNTLFFLYRDLKERKIFSSHLFVTIAAVILYFQYSWGSSILVLCINLILESQIRFIRENLKRDMDRFSSSLDGEFTAFSKGKEVLVNGNKLKKGNIFLAKEDEIVATDGVVFFGEARLEKNIFEREEIQVSKGSIVFGGSKVKEGSIQIEALSSQEDSFLGQLINRFKNVIDSKGAVESKLERIANFIRVVVIIFSVVIYFAPPLNDDMGIYFNHKIAAAGFLFSSYENLLDFIKLGYKKIILSEAQIGNSISGLDSLFKVDKIQSAVIEKNDEFDYGKYELYSINEELGFSKEELLVLAAHAQHLSNHPIGSAIFEAYIKLLKYKNLDINKPIRADFVEKFEELKDMGVTARVKGQLVFVGNEKLMRLINIRNLETDEGLTSVYIAINGKFAGRFNFTFVENEEIEKINEAFKDVGILKYASINPSESDLYHSLAGELEKKKMIACISREVKNGFGIKDKECLSVSIDCLKNGSIDEMKDISLKSSKILDILKDLKRYKAYVKSRNKTILYGTLVKVSVYVAGILLNISLSSIFAVDCVISFLILQIIFNKNKKQVDKEL